MSSTQSLHRQPPTILRPAQASALYERRQGIKQSRLPQRKNRIPTVLAAGRKSKKSVSVPDTNRDDAKGCSSGRGDQSSLPLVLISGKPASPAQNGECTPDCIRHRPQPIPSKQDDQASPSQEVPKGSSHTDTNIQDEETTHHNGPGATALQHPQTLSSGPSNSTSNLANIENLAPSHDAWSTFVESSLRVYMPSVRQHTLRFSLASRLTQPPTHSLPPPHRQSLPGPSSPPTSPLRPTLSSLPPHIPTDPVSPLCPTRPPSQDPSPAPSEQTEDSWPTFLSRTLRTHIPSSVKHKPLPSSLTTGLLPQIPENNWWRRSYEAVDVDFDTDTAYHRPAQSSLIHNPQSQIAQPSKPQSNRLQKSAPLSVQQAGEASPRPSRFLERLVTGDGEAGCGKRTSKQPSYENPFVREADAWTVFRQNIVWGFSPAERYEEHGWVMKKGQEAASEPERRQGEKVKKRSFWEMDFLIWK